MKKLIFLILAAVLVCSAQTPVFSRTETFAAVAAGTTITNIGGRALYYRLYWYPIGAPGACTVAVDSSTDGAAWSAGNVIAGQTCTTPGSVTLSTAQVFNYVRINVTALSANKSVTVTVAAYESVPSGASGTPVLNCALFPGADAGAKISACIAALGSTGGTADARNITGAQSLSATIAFTKPLVLLLGPITLTCSVDPCFSQAAGTSASVRTTIKGVGREKTTIIGAGGTALVMNLVDASGMVMEDLTINGGGSTVAAIKIASAVPGTTTSTRNEFSRVDFTNVGIAGALLWFNDVDNTRISAAQMYCDSAQVVGPANSIAWRIDNVQSQVNKMEHSVVGFCARAISNAETASQGRFALDGVDFEVNATCDVCLKSVYGVSISNVFTEGSLRFLDTNFTPITEIATLTLKNIQISSVTDAGSIAINYTSQSPLVLIGLQMPNGSVVNLAAGAGTQVTTAIGTQSNIAAPFTVSANNRLTQISSENAGSSNSIQLTKGEVVLDPNFAVRWTGGGNSQLYDDGTALVLTTRLHSYNGVTTVESGIPASHWNKTLTAQSANLAATDFVPAISSATAGRYRATCYVAVTQQATTSSTVPDCNLVCTDPTDSVAKTVQLSGAIAGVAVNPTTAVAEGGTGMCDAKAGTAIQFSTSNYASVGGTVMTYKIYIILEAM